MDYTELHLHTWDSLLDGLNNSKEYVERAAEIGMTHLAITDHGTLTGHREFQRETKTAGITPILGCEMYISPTTRFDRRAVSKRDDNTQAYNHVIVLAQNAEGLRNLNQLSELAWNEGFYSKPRVDMELLEEHSSGLIVLSGCLNGLIAKAIDLGDTDEADRLTGEFKRIFGDRFFIEVQGHNPLTINEGLLYYADKYDVLPVVTSDCHYARKEDLWLEEAMLILSVKPNQNNAADFKVSEKMEMLERLEYIWPERKMTFTEFELFLHTADEHKARLKKQGIGTDAITNTMVVADMIEDYPYYEGLDLLPTPTNDDADQILWDKIIAGAKQRGTYGVPEYDKRREEDFAIVKELGFAPYFLIEEDTVSWARENGIWIGPGRGSGVGFLPNYELGITNVDPIKRKLLTFRFIDPERGDWPDIDTDIEIARRHEVKSHLVKKWKHVASIATFGTFQGKNAVRDASRVLAVPLGDVNKHLKGADWPSQMDFFEMWGDTKLGREFIEKYPDVIKLAKFLYRRKRTQGMHAGGLVVSKEPVSNYAPMQSAKDLHDEAGARIPLIALDMNEAESIGFIKFDFLGLKTGTIIMQTLRNIKQWRGEDIDLDLLDPYDPEPTGDDKEIFKQIGEGYTKAVFQAEAGPYTNMLIDMGGVKNFDELVASNALVRPGAMKSTAGKQYIARKNGEEPVTFYHEDMRWFTEETYGVIIYQEQVMLTITELAGMSMGDANKIRKIIGKKRDVKEFDEWKDRFVDGASKKVSKLVAEKLWLDFEAHAGYSFNKSHAEAYSLISFWTAWLKYHYPLEFMAAVLQEEKDKESRLDYLIEAKRLGIPILLPHVNASEMDFGIQKVNGELVMRFGLANIKYISNKIAGRLIEARPFESYAHLREVSMTKGSGISSRVIDSLNKVGAATFKDHEQTGDPSEYLYEYLSIPAFHTSDLSPRLRGQLRPLDEFSPDETFVVAAMVQKVKTGPGWARLDIVDETGTAGVFVNDQGNIQTGQLYVFLIANNRIARYITVDELAAGEGGGYGRFLESTHVEGLSEGQYVVVSFNSRTTKAGKKMADVTFANEDKEMITALVWPTMFGLAHTICKEGTYMNVTFKEIDGGYAVATINGKN